jgi:hypothetical protein
MRRFSNILSFLAVALLLLCAASVTKASGADPLVGLGGGGSCGSFSEESLTQTFNNVLTGCVNDFTNATGLTLNSLTATITSSFFGSVSCFIDTSQPGNPPGNPPPFGTGTPTATNACDFTGQFSPILSALSLDDVLPGGVSGLQFGYPGLEFFPCDPATGGACATPLSVVNVKLSATTPEPGTMLLLGTGLVTLVTSRKRLKSAKHSV